MKLSKKTFLYSIFISSLLAGMIVVYFVAMLPSLYVDYMKEQYLQSVVDAEKGYMENRSYEGLVVQNPTGSATLEVPLTGDTLYLAGKAFRMAIVIHDDRIKQVLEEIRSWLGDMENLEEEKFKKIHWELLRETLEENSILKEKAPFSVKLSVLEGNEELSASGNIRVHMAEQGIFVFEANAADGDNHYTTYFAVGKTEDALVISFLPVMTPQMKEMKPIVLGSVPMIAAVLFLVVLVCSRYFSRRIVQPVIRLADYAEQVKYAENLEIPTMEISQKDEIGDLGRTLNELYEKLRSNYAQLEEKNLRLKEENKRQEVFLRASSHQLKTPVTAALLLVDGMLQEVGKYKDTRKYLPQVKEQLLSMRQIVEDILYLNHCTENLEKDRAALLSLGEEVLAAYSVQLAEKGLKSSVKGCNVTVLSDRKLLKKLLDNLISNAVSYTEEGGSLEVLIQKGKDGNLTAPGASFSVRNQKAHIEESLLPHIYEPFVSGTGRQKGKGLGLYIAAYYCEALGYSLHVGNTEEGVEAVLQIPKSCIPSSHDIHKEGVE